MTKNRVKRRRPSSTVGGSDPPLPPDIASDARINRLRDRAAGLLGRLALGPLIRFLAAFPLGIAGFLLTIAWQAAPQPALDAAKYSAFTASAEGEIVESWLATEWYPADMGELLRWHAFARSTPCAVVEFAGDWGTPARRAYCGNRYNFQDVDGLHDITTMAPGVPFGWVRDHSGFIMPEVRVTRAGLNWLTTHPPYSTFMLSKPPPASALEALEFQINRPVDDAVASWSTPLPVIPLAFDPRDPAGAMPAAYVDARRDFEPGRWVVALLFAAAGIFPWLWGMAILLGNVPPLARRVLSLLPLLTLPWWSEQFPNALHSVNKDLAGIVADMFGYIDRTERLIGSDPVEATLASGERLIFHVGQGAYSATFGRFGFTQPDPLPATGDAALVALTQIVTAQVRALNESEQTKLFVQLARDKTNDLRGAGLAFLPVAKEVLLDAKLGPPLRSAARRFLSEWVTQPIEEPYPRDLGYGERVRLFSELAAIPIPEISIMAKSVAERAMSRK